MSWSDLLAYWRSKHVGDIPPSRADIDPISEIPTLVRNVMLIDCLADGFRYRLVGSELAARLGRDATGRMAAQGGRYDPILTQRWIAALDLAMRTKEPQLVHSDLEGGGGILTLLLPLVSADGSVDMLMGGCFAAGSTEGHWHPITMERVDIAASGMLDHAPYPEVRDSSVVYLHRQAKYPS